MSPHSGLHACVLRCSAHVASNPGATLIYQRLISARRAAVIIAIVADVASLVVVCATAALLNLTAGCAANREALCLRVRGLNCLLRLLARCRWEPTVLGEEAERRRRVVFFSGAC